jgi:hypothetical protein
MAATRMRKTSLNLTKVLLILSYHRKPDGNVVNEGKRGAADHQAAVPVNPIIRRNEVRDR